MNTILYALLMKYVSMRFLLAGPSQTAMFLCAIPTMIFAEACQGLDFVSALLYVSSPQELVSWALGHISKSQG